MSGGETSRSRSRSEVLAREFVQVSVYPSQTPGRWTSVLAHKRAGKPWPNVMRTKVIEVTSEHPDLYSAVQAATMMLAEEYLPEWIGR